MLSKSLIQFSVEGWVCVLSLLFDLWPNCGGGNEDNADLLQNVPCMHCYIQCPQPCSRPLLTHASGQRLLGIQGQVWVYFLWGHCSFLLGSGAHQVLFVPSKSLFLQFCVSSGSSTVGLMATSSKRAFSTPKSAAPRAPVPAADHRQPVPLQEMLKHSSVSASVRMRFV